MTLRSKVLAAAGALAIAGVGYGAGIAQGYQPHMQNALRDLYAARSELNQAMTDKGGHRVQAINLVNQAIGQTQAGIAVGSYPYHGHRY